MVCIVRVMNSEKDEVMVVLATFPDEERARQIGTILVKNQVAACVNLLPAVRSIFQWEGKVEDEMEALAVIKTTRGAYARMESMLREAHPYEEPEVIALPVVAGSDGYLSWVAASVGAGPESQDV